jgi:hypothetical protein
MWAVLDKKDSETVIMALPPTVPVNELEKISNEGYVLIQMTLENTPAYMNGKYKNGKFYPKEEMELK